ncbi:hypothetical protein [Roseibacillus ishigakijimensis]|uniref:Repeat domain-containing protein n=1 Tax=Roseibacillus ishigakijimensis TaxID=454146 RepID=A0A934RSM2_9BACT|nr:hypothetical protein [Roseibacillus ishigakijimensis]MBK1833766.1 hypothetical protein [Roseibacillus ishigakijimensis]
MRLYFLLLLFFSLSLLSGAPHPADSNQDFRLTRDEVASVYGPEGFADAEFAQAWFIWRAGESYEDEATLASPYRWRPLPQGGPAFLSLSERRCLPLTPVKVIGLPANPGPLTARFRPLHTGEWLSLDLTVTGPEVSFFAPYVPSPWLPTREIEIEIASDSTTWRAGQLSLAPIELTGISVPQFLDDTATALASVGDWDADATVTRLAQGHAVDDFELLMGYSYAYLQHTAESFRRLAQAPPTPESELELLVARELLALYLGNSSAGEVTNRSRPLPKRKSNAKASGSDCVPINNWTDLIYYTRLRAKLEAWEDSDSLQKKATEEGLGKLQEGAEKLGDFFSSTADKFAKRAALAITIPLELHGLLSEWDRTMLPKTFTRIDYQLEDGNYAPLSQPMPTDSPYPSGECGTAHFAHLKATITSEGFRLGKYLLDSKVPEPGDLAEAVQGRKGEIAKKVVDYYEEPLGELRQQAIDRSYEQVKDLDYAPGGCTWSGIDIPQTRDDPKIEFSSQTGRFAVNASVANGLDPVGPGPDVIELKMLTTSELELTNSLPNTPAFTQLAPLTSGRPRLDFRPPAYSVDDVEDPPRLTVEISQSYENEKLLWKIYDNTGKLHYQELTTASDQSSPTESTHHLDNYLVPTDHEKYPLLCLVESQAQGCLEGSGLPPVQEYATLYYRAKVFDLSPSRICREPGEVITLTATPAKPDPDFEVGSWEIIQGGGTLEPLDETTATFTFPPDPEAEITVRATGKDDFIAQAYFTTGPCLKFVQASTSYAFNPATLAEGELHPTTAFGLAAAYGDFVTGQNSLIPLAAETYPGAEIVTGIGQAITHFKKEVTNTDPSTRTFEVESSGIILALVDAGEPRPLWTIEAAQIGGSYFRDEDFADDPREHVWLPTPGKGEGHPLPQLVTVTPDVYQLHFAEPLTKTSSLDETQLAATWLSAQGTVIATGGPVPDADDPETYYLTATIEYPRTVSQPDVNFTLSGTIHYPDPQNPDSDSFYSSCSVSHQIIEVKSSGTVRFPIAEETLVFCGPTFGETAPSSRPFALYNHCCGGIELQQFEKVRGAARRNFLASAYAANDPELGRHLTLISNYTDDANILYCEEQRKKREEHPIPPEDLPEPPDPEDPDPEPEDTPEELEDFFTNSPSNLDGPGDFPSPETPLPATTSGAILPEASGVSYPLDSTSLFTFETSLELAHFAANGSFQNSTLWLDQETRQAVADELTLVLYGQVSPGGDRGLFVEREFNGNHYFEFWRRDAVTGKFVARTLLTLLPGQHIIGLGDFDQDGHLDLAGRDQDANLLVWRGQADGFASSAQTLLASQGSWLPRAAAVNPDRTTLLLSESHESSSYRHQVLTPTGAISHDRTAERPQGMSVQSPADFNDDGWPDLLFHLSGFGSFEVHYGAPGGAVSGGLTYSLPDPNTTYLFTTLPQSSRNEP